MPKERSIFIIAKLREFDEAAWRRLIIAYAYALLDAERREAAADHGGEEDTQAGVTRQEGTV